MKREWRGTSPFPRMGVHSESLERCLERKSGLGLRGTDAPYRKQPPFQLKRPQNHDTVASMRVMSQGPLQVPRASGLVALQADVASPLKQLEL